MLKVPLSAQVKPCNVSSSMCQHTVDVHDRSQLALLTITPLQPELAGWSHTETGTLRTPSQDRTLLVVYT
jgi:hypothetical protein